MRKVKEMAKMIILAYRMIPPRLRRVWSFGSSSSHLALADPGWASIRKYAVAPAWRIAVAWVLIDRGGASWSDPRDL